MNSVTIYDKKSDDIIKIVRELTELGWVKGVDFDFAYYRDTGMPDRPTRYTVFSFYKEEYSTYFALRWG